MDGKNPPLPVLAPKVFRCNSCSANIGIRAPGSSIVVACEHCGTVIDPNDENLRILSQAKEHLKHDPPFPLGSKGKLRGVVWQFIGLMERTDGSGYYSWWEYLLFNPVQGYRWLTETKGHWVFIRTIIDRPGGNENAITYQGERFVRFEKGVAKVRYVAGEFYWRVKVGDAANLSDYVCPPKMLSLEETSGERIWSLGDHLEPSEVADAFGIPFYKLPVRTGTGAVQPNPHFIVESGIASVWLFSSLAVFLIFLAFMPFYQSRLIYSEVLTPVPGVEGAVTTPAFEITSKHSNAELSLLADVNNNWLEIEGELAGESSNYSEDFDLGVEYYSGYDSDGAWSEGSKSGSHFFSSLPRGTYHLRLKSSGAAVRHQVKLREGVWMWSNLFLSWALLASIPFWVLLRKKRFELARWSNSDFLPTGNLRPEDDE